MSARVEEKIVSNVKMLRNIGLDEAEPGLIVDAIFEVLNARPEIKAALDSLLTNDFKFLRSDLCQLFWT